MPVDDPDNTTELRFQLLANGYTPLANLDKRCLLPGWPTLEVDDAMIRRWGRSRKYRGTGLRLDNELAMIDADVDHTADTMMALEQAMVDAVPKLSDALMRFGKGNKFALFCRVDEPFNRIQSHSFVAPGETEDDGAHRIEIFGGSTARQAGSFGPHSLDEAGETLIEYEWADDRSPATIPLEELPVLTKQEFFAAVAAAQAWLVANGFEQIKMSAQGEDLILRRHDLTPGMQFDCNDDETRTLDELREWADTAHNTRCSASWLEGPSAVNRSRCLVSLARSGGVSVYETASGVTYLEKDFKPVEPVDQAAFGEAFATKLLKAVEDIDVSDLPELGESWFERAKRVSPSNGARGNEPAASAPTVGIDRAAEREAERTVRRVNRINAADTALPCANKLLQLYAFMPGSRTPVLPIYDCTDDESVMTMANFRALYHAHRDEDVGPRGGRVITHPVDIWLGSHKRINIAGVRMRPDMPAPLYEEHGKRWLNTYRQPDHGEVLGNTTVIHELLEQVVPDEAERGWFKKWLAYKWRHPHVPGPAVVMVARKQGTGRGTLARLVSTLFGPRYVRTIPFAIFAGQNYQSQYTDWGAGALMACVNESSQAVPGLGDYKVKAASYEHLKEIVDPRPHERTFVTKGRNSFEALSTTSYLVFTNNLDALPIPPGDRRFAVLTNGEPREPEFWARINTAIDDQTVIAGFVHELMTVELDGYNPFAAPLETLAKDEMIDMGKSDMDEALELAIESMPQPVFTLEQILTRMDDVRYDNHLQFPSGAGVWKAVAKRLVARSCFRVGQRSGPNYYIKYENRRQAVYAKTIEVARYWGERPGLREWVLKNDRDAAKRGAATGLRLVPPDSAGEGTTSE